MPARETLPFLTPENAFLFRITHVENLPWILDNGLHCRSSSAQDRFYSSLDDLCRIDWAALRSGDFKRDPKDPGRFERYQAEALIHRHLPASALSAVVCSQPEQIEEIRGLVKARSLTVKVRARERWYF